ncbi:MAG: DUF554 domain-containing protein [Clostridia bacterium]|nr:DUF554 domain-containing protein [Clostridia bacterium]
MIGLGTIVNVAAVVAAGFIGVLVKGGIKERFQTTIMGVLGISTMFIGASGTLQEMFTVENGSISTQGTMLLVMSLIIGAVIGELLNIEAWLEKVGEWLKEKVKAKNDNRFVDAFVNSTLVICIGAMAIVGSLQDGLTGDHSTLFVKAALDFPIILIFASTLGIGAVFSAIPLGLYQGAITLFAGLISPYLSDTLISNLTLVGSAMIFAIGVNLAFGKKFKVGNFLPGLLVPVIYEIITKFI